MDTAMNRSEGKASHIGVEGSISRCRRLSKYDICWPERAVNPSRLRCRELVGASCALVPVDPLGLAPVLGDARSVHEVPTSLYK
jgi:hypothetical protein